MSFSKHFGKLMLATCLSLSAAPAFSYSISHGKVVDDKGNQIQLRGVNWFGFETGDHVVNGLWARNWKEFITQLQGMGFNAIRLPFCPANLNSNTSPSSIDYSRNPDLQGLSSLQILDKVVKELSDRRMYVLLDHHRPDCSAISELWYTDSYSEKQWIDDLRFVAHRYANVHGVIGLEVKNEPHGRTTWGTGDPKTDWNTAVEHAAAAILEAAPKWLIGVEGIGENPICSSTIGHFWGENLEPMDCTPLKVPADHLLLMPHVYGPDVYVQPYFNSPDFPNNMAAIWDKHFGHFAKAGYAMAIGEFGGKYGEGDPRDIAWQNAFVDYLISIGVTDAFYWAANQNSVDTGGMVGNDWTTPRDDKVKLLNKLWNAGGGASGGSGGGAGASSGSGAGGGSSGGAGTGSGSGAGGGSSGGAGTGSGSGAGGGSSGGAGASSGSGAGGGSSGGAGAGSGSGARGGSSGGAGAGSGSGAGGGSGSGSDPTKSKIAVNTIVDSDWHTGYCERIQVTNTSDSPNTWTVTIPIKGKIQTLWSARWSVKDNALTAFGMDWNKTLDPKGRTEFGFCSNY
ncbi:cellulase family glycosylhydrolase [Xylella fastidiosa]|uniref:cellulase family glycosylhydrolase n=1 Tax=Xylella fastidiosa TaxID=2371 RepID=UPI001123DCC4|nr:glycoside hydrolase family 5 protein [Xylella fastidiosa]TNW17920.1 endoglucanase [Xylella fastidiosa]